MTNIKAPHQTRFPHRHGTITDLLFGFESQTDDHFIDVRRRHNSQGDGLKAVLGGCNEYGRVAMLAILHNRSQHQITSAMKAAHSFNLRCTCSKSMYLKENIALY